MKNTSTNSKTRITSSCTISINLILTHLGEKCFFAHTMLLKLKIPLFVCPSPFLKPSA